MNLLSEILDILKIDNVIKNKIMTYNKVKIYLPEFIYDNCIEFWDENEKIALLKSCNDEIYFREF